MDVRSQLKQILAKGASPTELIETLRRRERFEPLPQHAHEEVLRLLNDAAEQSKEVTEQSDVSVGEMVERNASAGGDAGAASTVLADQLRTLQEQVTRQGTDYETLLRTFERTKDVQTAASERVTALASELATATRSLEAEQSKVREYGKALAERSASAEAHQSRGEELLRKTRDYEAELRTVREALAAREVEFSAIRQAHARLKTELEQRDQNAPQLIAELHAARSGASAVAADLAAARALLETEQHKALALDKSHADLTNAAATLRAQMQEALRNAERHEAESRTLRMALADRDAELATLKQQQATSALGQETTAKTGMQLQADLSTARARADALLVDLNSSRGAAASLDAQLKRAKFDLDAARNELASVKAQAHSYLDLLRTHEWRRASQHSATSDDEALAATGQSAETLLALNDQLQSRLNTVQIQLEQRDTFIAQMRAAKAERPIDPAPMVASEAAGAVEPTDAEIDLQRGTLAESQAESVGQPLPSMHAARAPLVVSGSWRPPPPAAPGRAVSGGMLAWGAVAAMLVIAIWMFVQRNTRAPVESIAAVNTAPGAVIHDCPDCPAMAVLPAGRFRQGDPGPSSFDKPVHSVAIAHPFAVSMNAVTVDQFAAFVAATDRDMQGCDTYDGSWKHDPAATWKNPGFAQTGAHPVTCASWNDAQAYASWLSSKSGHHYRLPSASEWEYAARAGAEASAPWGAASAEACASANVADRSAAQQFPGWSVFGCSDGFVYTAPVGSFKINAFGLNDMLGNVFQWTQDCWNANYVGAPVDGSARADGNCAQRELRGGSWFSNPTYVSANYRNHFAADYRTSSVGIRLVRELE